MVEIGQAFLDHAKGDLKPLRLRDPLSCDNALWHRNSRINWPMFGPITTPPYSPDFKPIELIATPANQLTCAVKWSLRQ
jgi:transposase